MSEGGTDQGHIPTIDSFTWSGGYHALGGQQGIPAKVRACAVTHCPSAAAAASGDEASKAIAGSVATTASNPWTVSASLDEMLM